MASKHPRRHRVKGAEPRHSFDDSAGDRRDSRLHLARRLVGEGDGEDLARPRLARGNEVGETRRERRGLSRSRAGQDQHRAFGRQHGLALGRVEALQVGGVRQRDWQFRHDVEVSGGERNGNRRAPCFASRRRFLRFCPISSLSTGRKAKISLSRLGAAVHGEQVIGTAVPASFRSRQRQQEAAGDQRSDLRRQAMIRAFGF